MSSLEIDNHSIILFCATTTTWYSSVTNKLRPQVERRVLAEKAITSAPPSIDPSSPSCPVQQDLIASRTSTINKMGAALFCLGRIELQMIDIKQGCVVADGAGGDTGLHTTHVEIDGSFFGGDGRAPHLACWDLSFFFFLTCENDDDLLTRGN